MKHIGKPGSCIEQQQQNLKKQKKGYQVFFIQLFQASGKDDILKNQPDDKNPDHRNDRPVER
jgi:hypothetical protein